MSRRHTAYFDGARMAYADVADLMTSMAANLPPELSFAAGIRKKIEILDFHLMGATEQ